MLVCELFLIAAWCVVWVEWGESGQAISGVVWIFLGQPAQYLGVSQFLSPRCRGLRWSAGRSHRDSACRAEPKFVSHKLNPLRTTRTNGSRRSLIPSSICSSIQDSSLLVHLRTFLAERSSFWPCHSCDRAAVDRCETMRERKMVSMEIAEDPGESLANLPTNLEPTPCRVRRAVQGLILCPDRTAHRRPSKLTSYIESSGEWPASTADESLCFRHRFCLPRHKLDGGVRRSRCLSEASPRASGSIVLRSNELAVDVS